MMRVKVSTADVGHAMARLNAVFPKFGDEAELKLAIGGYHDALRDLDADELAGAVAHAIREEKRFPYPATLREHARAWAKRNRVDLLPAPAPNGEEVLCKVCGARPRMAWLEATHWKTGEVTMVQRVLGACIAERHPKGSWHVPLPPNFVDWADA